MSERTVTIRLDLQDPAGMAEQLQKIRVQRDALLTQSKIKLNIGAGGLDQARRASAQAQAASASAMKDLGALGGAITSKAIAPLAQYQVMLGSVLQAGRALGPGVVSALKGVSAEFARQKDLAAFWGTSGYMHSGVASLKSALSGFVATGGAGFGTWLKNTSESLVQYRMALVASAAVMIGMAAAAALSSKHTQNYIASTLDSRLMARKLTDKKGAEEWVQSAQGTDWSAGRESRMGVFQTVLSKNKMIGQKAAQKATEDIEKYFFANQEMLQKKGIASAEALASSISAPQLVGEDATKFEDIFGLGFSNLSPQARLGRLSTEAKGIDINKAVAARPDEVLTKRLTATTGAMGDAVIPVLNTVLGGFLNISDAIGKIPGLGAVMGWGAVLVGAAAAGLTVVSMVGSLIPGLMTMIGLVRSDTVARYANIAAQYAMAAASKVVAAAQWLLNVAMTANPLGIAIMAIVGLIVILYALEKRFGLVSKAWKLFSESSIGKGVFAYIESGKKSIEDLLGMLGKAYKSGGLKGVMNIALDALGAASPQIKVLLILVDFLRKLWANSNILNKAFATGLTYWQRMIDFFTWLLSTIKGMWDWLMNAIPGARKEEARQKLEKEMERAGVSYNAGNKEYTITKGPNKGVVIPGDEMGGYAGQKYLGSEGKRIIDLKIEYEKLPGFAEGIAAAVKEGLAGLEKSIADAIAKALTDIPGMQSIAETLKSLNTTISDLKQWMDDHNLGGVAAGVGNAAGTVPWIMVLGPAGAPVKAIWDATIGAYKPEEKPTMASGGQIKATGSLIGHRDEEMDPASVVAGGKTTLERINEMFSGGDTYQGGQSITVHAPVSMAVKIEKVSSDMDIDHLISRIGNEGADKLLFALRNKLDNTSNRGIGYMRG